MSTALAPDRLDDLAAQIIAGVATEAQELAAQPFFSELMEQVEKRPAHRRRYTGAEFFLREPARFRDVVGYLADGKGLLWIADRVGCSHHTVAAVRDHFPKAVAIEKERLADRCHSAASLMVEKIIEEPEKVPAQAWGLVAAQLIDKALLLRGGPSMTIEHRHTFSHDDYLQLVKGAPIDVESEALPMGSLPEKAAAMRPPAASATPAQVEHGLQSATDSASVDSQIIDTPATLTPPSPTDLARPGEGGGEPALRGGLESDAL